MLVEGGGGGMGGIQWERKDHSSASDTNITHTWAEVQSYTMRPATRRTAAGRTHKDPMKGHPHPDLEIVCVTATARYTLCFLGIHTPYTLQKPGIHV